MKKLTCKLPSTVLPLTKLVADGLPTKKEVAPLIREIEEKKGLLNAIIVMPVVTDTFKEGPLFDSILDKYTILDGKSRFVAAKAMEWREINTFIVPWRNPLKYPREKETVKLLVKIAQDLQRSKLRDYDVATYARDLSEEHDFNPSLFSTVFGISIGYMYNLVRWLKNIPPPIVKEWKQGSEHLTHNILEELSRMSHPEGIKLYEDYKTQEPQQFQTAYRPGKKQKPAPRKVTRKNIDELRVAIHKARLKKDVQDLCIGILDYCAGIRTEISGLQIGREE